MLRLHAFTRVSAWESERMALTVTSWRLPVRSWEAAAVGAYVAERPAIWMRISLQVKARGLC